MSQRPKILSASGFDKLFPNEEACDHYLVASLHAQLLSQIFAEHEVGNLSGSGRRTLRARVQAFG